MNLVLIVSAVVVAYFVLNKNSNMREGFMDGTSIMIYVCSGLGIAVVLGFGIYYLNNRPSY